MALIRYSQYAMSVMRPLRCWGGAKSLQIYTSTCQQLLITPPPRPPCQLFYHQQYSSYVDQSHSQTAKQLTNSFHHVPLPYQQYQILI